MQAAHMRNSFKGASLREFFFGSFYRLFVVFAERVTYSLLLL